MKLYFGNMVTTVTTIMIIALVGFIGYSVWNRNTISYWGCRNLFFADVWSCHLLLCSGQGWIG